MRIRDIYNKKDLEIFIQMADEFREIIRDTDKILRTDCNSTLGAWVDSALNLAKAVGDDDVLDLYEYNAKIQVTLWGPNGEIVDYANKQWGGMVKDFFLPRWEVFFTFVNDSIANNIDLDENVVRSNIFGHVELPFVHDRYYSRECGGE